MINASTSSFSISTEDLMEMKNTYSDLHKDVYGFRPRGYPQNDLSLVEEYNYLLGELKVRIEEERINDAIEKAKEMELVSRFSVDCETLVKWGVLEGYQHWRSGGEWFYIGELNEKPLTRPKLKSKAEVKKAKKAAEAVARTKAANRATRWNTSSPAWATGRTVKAWLETLG